MYGLPGSKVISELVKLKVRIANVTFRIYIFYSDIKSIGFTHQTFRGGILYPKPTVLYSPVCIA